MAYADHVWQILDDQPPLQENQVAVWRASLAQPNDVVRRLNALLTPDEQARAARFRFPAHQQDFIVARGVLRTILGGYLAVAPSSITFHYDDFGKPSLNAAHRRQVCFNLSHSGGVALYAMTRNRLIGIDVEYIRPMPDMAGIARSNFSTQEYAQFCDLPAADRPQAFFNCWTRKEAYIKAVGQGLNMALDSFDVTFAPGQKAQLARVAGSRMAARRWVMYELPVGSGYAAALVGQAPITGLACFQWTPHLCEGQP